MHTRMVALHLGVSCPPDDAGFVGMALARYMFYPQWVFVFSSVLALIDDRLYFVIASLLTYTLLSLYADFVSRQLGMEIEYCGVSFNAIPESQFVSSMTFTIVVAIGFLRDRVKFGYITGLLAWTAPFLYMAATLYTGFFTPMLLFANVLMSILAAAFFVSIYYATNNTL